MPQRQIFSIVVFSLFCLVGASLSGCVVANRPYGYVHTPPGPVMYDYWYYPDVQVYYNYSSGMYFYLGTGGVWIETRTLPPTLRYRLGSHISIHSRYQRPYREYEEHRRAYPPRQREKERHYDRRDDYREPPRYYQPQPKTWRELNEGQEQRQERRYPEDRDRSYNREPANRSEPQRRYPIVKNPEKNPVKDKKQNNKKHSGKDKKSKDKDKKDRGDDRSDKKDDQNPNTSRDWERRVR